jgi:hypothetical protein
MMVGLSYVIQEMGIFPMSVANNLCDIPLPKYLDLKTVLIYRLHPVYENLLHFYFISIFPLQSCEEFLTKIMQKIREESQENKFSATLLAVLFFTQSALSAVIYSGLAGE